MIILGISIGELVQNRTSRTNGSAHVPTAFTDSNQRANNMDRQLAKEKR
jgi:hypothetical protein